jgi:hypothetical protein
MIECTLQIFTTLTRRKSGLDEGTRRAGAPQLHMYLRVLDLLTVLGDCICTLAARYCTSQHYTLGNSIEKALGI